MCNLCRSRVFSRVIYDCEQTQPGVHEGGQFKGHTNRLITVSWLDISYDVRFYIPDDGTIILIWCTYNSIWPYRLVWWMISLGSHHSWHQECHLSVVWGGLWLCVPDTQSIWVSDLDMPPLVYMCIHAYIRYIIIACTTDVFFVRFMYYIVMIRLWTGFPN